MFSTDNSTHPPAHGSKPISELNRKLSIGLLNHVSLVLTGLDFVYFIILYFTATHPYLSVFLAILFPAVNLPFLRLANKTGIPYIQYSLTFTLIPMFLVTYYSGVAAPGWLLCFSGVAATQIMVEKQPYKNILIAGFVLCATAGSWLAGKAPVDVVSIFVTLLAFAFILNRVLSYLILQNMALHRAQTELVLAAQAKNQFLSNMNHELRTPMNGVLGTVQLLAGTSISKEQRKYIRMLERSGEHLLHIINDILDISKMESGGFSIENQPYELRKCIGNIDIFFQQQLAKQANQFGVYVDPKIPVLLLGDTTRLHQILINLVGNANKFCHDGTIGIDVTLEREQAQTVTLLFKVSDTGVGIAPDKQKSIFEAFSQADESTTREFGGTGLGLSICQQIVLQMGGEIWLESEPDQGSTFLFRLDADKVEPELEPESEQEAEPVATEVDKTQQVPEGQLYAQRYPLSILVAEDNMINQMVVTELMSSIGYTVDMANNGAEALTAVAKQDYDLIFMDIQMPVMDGLEATRILKSTAAADVRPLIVAMTANTLPADVEKCLSAGMVGHISKPIEISKIRAMIRQWYEAIKEEN